MVRGGSSSGREVDEKGLDCSSELGGVEDVEGLHGSGIEGKEEGKGLDLGGGTTGETLLGFGLVFFLLTVSH